MKDFRERATIFFRILMGYEEQNRGLPVLKDCVQSIELQIRLFRYIDELNWVNRIHGFFLALLGAFIMLGICSLFMPGGSLTAILISVFGCLGIFIVAKYFIKTTPTHVVEKLYMDDLERVHKRFGDEAFFKFFDIKEEAIE